MSTTTIAVLFLLLLTILGFVLFGGNKSTPQTVHTMPDGTVMQNTDPIMNAGTVPAGAHMMPDGSMMMSDGTHTMPDGTVMQNTNPAVLPPTSSSETPMNHSM